MSGKNDVIEQLKTAVTCQNSASLETITFQIGDIVLHEGALPNEIFRIILELFEDQGFLHLEGSWKVIRVFEDNWKYISERQRSALFPVIEAQFELFHDWMACFVIAGILGELYCNERAVDALVRLQSTKKEIPRSLVPHGFEHIAVGTSDKNLARRALAELTRMGRDESERVRAEVEESLSRLRKNEARKRPK